MPVALAEITADGPAIHGSCEADIRIPAADAERAVSLLEEQFRVIKERYRQTDPSLEFAVCVQDGDKAALLPADSANIIRVMFLLHTGVRKSDAEDLNIIITSVTFSAISLVDGVFTGKYVVRSVEDSVGLLWHRRMEELVRMLGFTSTLEHEYPAWPIGGNCVMQSKFAEGHLRLFGSEICRLHEHASIEANVILGCIPDMDAIAIQPTATDFHTPAETLYVDEVQPFWDLLLAVLKRKDSE
jgi:dipeptidase D